MARKQKLRQRYSIGEWYGLPLENLGGEWATRAQRELELSGVSGTPCPFQKQRDCNKKGGVCSLRLYEQTENGPVSPKGPLVTTCPSRFLEEDEIFKWVGEVILKTDEAMVLGEIGFLDRGRTEEPVPGEEDDGKEFIGRIDNVLVHPSREPLDWCALELQAVYFSGRSMQQEFNLLARHATPELPFPAAQRRPDWRSSGPKRLLPQLQTKVPTIRTWGKKMAVVIDEAFFESLIGLEREKHLSNAEIAWFVVGYDPTPNGWKLARREAVFTRLDASVKALTGGVPLSKERFEAQLSRKLGGNFPAP